MKKQNFLKATLLSAISLATVISCSSSDFAKTNDYQSNQSLSSTTSTEADAEAKRKILNVLSANVIIPAYQNLYTSTLELQTALKNLATNVSDNTLLTTAQEKWKSNMSVYQQTELFQFGPAGSSSGTIGGQDYRNLIYSWPSTSQCGADTQLTNQNYANSSFLGGSLVNVKGLDILEYLLFDIDSTNACSDGHTINFDGTWNTITSELKQRRADYAVTLINDIVTKTKSLKEAWETDKGNYINTLVNAGSVNSPYSSLSAAMDDVFAGMYYLELEVKDDKLGKPAGIIGSNGIDKNSLEARYAYISKENIIANIKSFQQMYLGGDPNNHAYGFDDLLKEKSQTELSDSINQNLNETINAFEQFSGNLYQSFDSNIEGVKALYTQLKKVTDQIKNEFSTSLGLNIPQEGAGDND